MVGILERQLLGLALVAVGARTLEPSGAGLERRRVAVRMQVAVGVALPLVQLLGSTAGIGRGPCMLSSRHDRSIFHSGYTRRPQVGWGDNSIAPVVAPG